jgi:Core-2/I-Branching enzyme
MSLQDPANFLSRLSGAEARLSSYNKRVPAPRIAFLILAHNDALHLERLCRALQGQSSFVHVDRRAVDFPLGQIIPIPGVTVIHPCSLVHWGDFSMIEATLSLLNNARRSGAFDRFVLLSGSCYPVKPLANLEEAFAGDSRREWISLTPITRQSSVYNTVGRHWRMAPLLVNSVLDSKVRAVYNKISKAMGRDLAREIGLTPYFGSQWWGLTEPCVTSILEFVRNRPNFVRAYRSVYAPDEHFFHTIVANSHFASSAFYVEDRGSATNQLAPLHQIGPARDRYFGNAETDFQIAASTNKFFIRKVSTARSAQLLDRIDRELLGIASEAPSISRSQAD